MPTARATVRTFRKPSIRSSAYIAPNHRCVSQSRIREAQLHDLCTDEIQDRSPLSDVQQLRKSVDRWPSPSSVAQRPQHPGSAQCAEHPLRRRLRDTGALDEVVAGEHGLRKQKLDGTPCVLGAGEFGHIAIHTVRKVENRLRLGLVFACLIH
jgi:hypothetical protein